MESELYEMDFSNGGLKKVDTTKNANLKRGQVLHWRGSYSTKYAILSEESSDYGIRYKCVSLKDHDEDYQPRIHYIQSHSVVSPEDDSLTHTQHHYITTETVEEEELIRLEGAAEAIKKAETEKQEIEEAKAEKNRAKRTEGKRLISIRLCYNDSDSMTDYYQPCASIKEWILAEIPQGRRDLKLLRKELNKYKSLNCLSWTEHRENHSMNRFGYSLTSDSVKISDYTNKQIKGYDGRIRENGFLMLQFWGSAGSDDWPEKAENNIINNTHPEAIKGASGATLSENKEKAGVELRFSTKPDNNTLDALKAKGWRWSRYNACWYKKVSEQAKTEAEEIIKGAA